MLTEMFVAELRRRGRRVKVPNLGHVQVHHGGLIFNWWPDSAKRSVHIQPVGKTYRHVDSVDEFEAIIINPGRFEDIRKRKLEKRNRNDQEMGKPVATERFSCGPLYSGLIPPWDESLGEYRELRLDES